MANTSKNADTKKGLGISKSLLKGGNSFSKSRVGRNLNKKLISFTKSKASGIKGTIKNVSTKPLLIFVVVALVVSLLCSLIMSNVGQSKTDESDIYDICMNHAEITDIYKTEDYAWVSDCRDQIYSLRQSSSFKLADSDRNNEDKVKEIRYKKIMSISFLMEYWMTNSKSPFSFIEGSDSDWSGYVACFTSENYQENLENYFTEASKINTSETLTEEEKVANEEQQKVVDVAQQKVINDSFWDKLEDYLDKNLVIDTKTSNETSSTNSTNSLSSLFNFTVVNAEQVESEKNKKRYVLDDSEKYTILTIAKIAYDRGYCGSTVGSDDIQWPVEESAIVSTSYTSFADKSDRPDFKNLGVVHFGFDFGVPVNTPVYAVFDGTFSTNGLTGLNGWSCIKSDKLTGIHGLNLNAYYNHLNSTVVSTGDYVTKGQLIGYSGTASGVAHLCFKITEIGESTKERMNPDNYRYYYPFSYFGLKDPQPLCRDKNEVNGCLAFDQINTGELSEY